MGAILFCYSLLFASRKLTATILNIDDDHDHPPGQHVHAQHRRPSAPPLTRRIVYAGTLVGLGWRRWCVRARGTEPFFFAELGVPIPDNENPARLPSSCSTPSVSSSATLTAPSRSDFNANMVKALVNKFCKLMSTMPLELANRFQLWNCYPLGNRNVKLRPHPKLFG